MCCQNHKALKLDLLHPIQEPLEACYGCTICPLTDTYSPFKNHPLKIKTATFLQNLSMNHPCFCLHFSPLGPLRETVGDLKPWNNQKCQDHTKASLFVPLPKWAPNPFFFPSGTQPREVKVWLLLCMLCSNMFHAFQLLTSSIWEMAKCDGVNINRAWVVG